MTYAEPEGERHGCFPTVLRGGKWWRWRWWRKGKEERTSTSQHSTRDPHFSLFLLIKQRATDSWMLDKSAICCSAPHRRPLTPHPQLLLALGAFYVGLSGLSANELSPHSLVFASPDGSRMRGRRLATDRTLADRFSLFLSILATLRSYPSLLKQALSHLLSRGSARVGAACFSSFLHPLSFFAPSRSSSFFSSSKAH